MSKYYHSCVRVDKVPVDVLLTEEEVKKATTRALKNPEDIPCGDSARCWPIDCRDSKCSLLQWIMGKCCECGECDD